MKKTVFTNTFFVALCALLCTALWGSATPFIKTGYLCLNVEGTPSIMLFAGIRFALAGILLYLSFLSAVAYALWGILLKYNPVSKVTIFSFMTPVFGVILSRIILTESSAVSLFNVLVALVLTCVGIITINYQKKQRIVILCNCYLLRGEILSIS